MARCDAINAQFREHVDIVIRIATITEHERLQSKETLEAIEKKGMFFLDPPDIRRYGV